MIKLALIGLGPIGSMHAGNLLAGKVANAQLVAICDSNPKMQEKYESLAYYSDVDAMLAEGGFDAVLVATPSFTHYNFAKKILNAGYHALIEKPIALCTADALEIKELARAKNLQCAVMLNQRTTPLYMRIKELIDSDVIGKINRISWTMTNWYRPNIYFSSSDWRGTWKGEAGGVLINQSIHNLDIWAWVFGLPKSIKAWCKYGKYHDIEVEDEVVSYMQLKDGSTATFITSTGEYTGVNRLEIAGDKAFVVAQDSKLEIKIFKGISLSAFTKDTNQPFSSPECETSIEEFSDVGVQHVGVISNFVDSILGIAKLDYDVEEGVKSLEMANAMLMSSWQDSTIELGLDHNAYKGELNKHIASSSFRENIAKVGAIDFSKSFK